MKSSVCIRESNTRSRVSTTPSGLQVRGGSNPPLGGFMPPECLLRGPDAINHHYFGCARDKENGLCTDSLPCRMAYYARLYSPGLAGFIFFPFFDTLLSCFDLINEQADTSLKINYGLDWLIIKLLLSISWIIRFFLFTVCVTMVRATWFRVIILILWFYSWSIFWFCTISKWGIIPYWVKEKRIIGFFFFFKFYLNEKCTRIGLWVHAPGWQF